MIKFSLKRKVMKKNSHYIGEERGVYRWRHIHNDTYKAYRTSKEFRLDGPEQIYHHGWEIYRFIKKPDHDKAEFMLAVCVFPDGKVSLEWWRQYDPMCYDEIFETGDPESMFII